MKRIPIGKLVALINRQNQKYLAKELKDYQLGGGGQHSFLIEILTRPGINQDQLTNDLKFDKATTARTVKFLENAGYIERKVDDKDRRSCLLYPTEKGKNFQPILLGILNDANRRLTGRLTENEENQLVSLLNKMYENIRE